MRRGLHRAAHRRGADGRRLPGRDRAARRASRPCSRSATAGSPRATEPEGERLLATLRSAGEQGPNLAELGIGTNEKATLTGNILEDEKILGTVHVAFGASAGIGGTVSVPVHLDCLILEPTLDIDGTRVLDAGRFVL